MATPFPFPFTFGNVIICPFWADLDTSVGGTISYNNGTQNTNITTRVAQLIQEAFGCNFNPTGVFTTTWNMLPHHDALGSISLRSLVS
jgi:hypothetical protein